MMRHVVFGLISVLLITLCAAAAPVQGFVVIVNPSNRFDTLSRAKVSFLFSRKVSRWPWGAEAQPIELEPHTPAYHWFVTEIMRTTNEQLSSYWIDQRTTRGISPPHRVPDAAAAKRLVAARPGAIAYIPIAELDNTVKAIKVEP